MTSVEPCVRDSLSKATRIDPAHVLLAPGSAVDAKERAASAMSTTGGRPADQDLLERQARTIAEQLRAEQLDLDGREAEFNARIARLEAELRAERLRQSERDDELSRRARELDERAYALEARSADLIAAELAARQVTSSSRHEATLPGAPPFSAAWRARLREFDRQERTLQAHFADVATERRQIAEERRALTAVREKCQQEEEARRRQLELEWEERSRELQDHTARLDRRQEVVRRMHADLSRLYRDAIETQICTEETWSRLQEDADPAIAAHIAEARRKLADEYQLAEQCLGEERRELQQVLDAIRAESAKLHDQRTELRDWYFRRQADLERQSAAVQDRQRALDDRDANFRFAEQAWDEQRREFEREIRRLKRLVQDE